MGVVYVNRAHNPRGQDGTGPKGPDEKVKPANLYEETQEPELPSFNEPCPKVLTEELLQLSAILWKEHLEVQNRQDLLEAARLAKEAEPLDEAQLGSKLNKNL